MQRDGDCFFKAMRFNVLNLRSHSALNDHLKSLGLFQIDSIEEMAMKLRAMMVNELVSNKERYVGFLQEYGMQEWEERVTQFLQPGVFSGDVGDLMVKATVNVLKVPLILLTSIENYPVINVTPDEFVEGCSDFCLFVAYSREGPGHYDALFESQGGMETAEEVSAKTARRCTCGMNSKEVRNVCCKSEASGSRQYASRCPCLKIKQSCGGNCKCNGCNNPYGKKVSSKTNIGKSTKRKRSKDQLGGDRKRGLQFMIDNDESVSDGKWTDEENLILLQHLMAQPEVLESNISKQMVTKLTNAYNESANEAVNILKLNLVRLKDENQVKQKLQHLKQRKELALLLIEEQISLSVKKIANLKWNS